MHIFLLMRILITSVFLFASTTAAVAGPAKSHVPRAKAAQTPLVVASSAFRNTEAIPQDYTCEGVKRPPPLTWSKAPADTKSFAILVEDPGAHGFTHWLVTGIPAATRAIEPGKPLPAEAIVSKNSDGSEGYAPPCPPKGRHRYIFHVYALDLAPDAAKPTTRKELMTAIKGHVLAQGAMVGTYQKSR